VNANESGLWFDFHFYVCASASDKVVVSFFQDDLVHLGMG